jgi:alkylmercury lyase
LFAFCVADTLPFTPILGEPAHIDYTCPTTRYPIRVELAPDRVLDVDPAAAMISQVALYTTTDIRASICDHGHFFASPAAAEPWRQAHPDGQVLGVSEFFDIALSTAHELGWTCSQPPLRD